MYIHEDQAKGLCRQYNVKSLPGVILDNISQIDSSLKQLNTNIIAIKARTHTGGRGKAGGVVITTKEKSHQVIKDMLGMKLITKQTGENGKKVHSLYLEEGCDIARQLYFSIILDRANQSITLLASEEGGVNIEEVAESNPEKILKLHVHPLDALHDPSLEQMAQALNLRGALSQEFIYIAKQLYKLFLDKDAAQIEINPLVVTKNNELLALDAKMNFDSNALFRHEDIRGMRDIREEDPIEYHANQVGLNYVRLDGYIGCMVNGAGLAMATMDLLHHLGGAAANFLDVGGSATQDQIEEAFRIITTDKIVTVLLINIFGGIMKCDTIAAGIVQAAKNLDITIPIVVRLEGTNALEARNILEQSNMSFITAVNLSDAAQQAVSLSQYN